MNLVWSALVVAAVASLAVAAMLMVRRSAPEGSYFTDGDRASGVFGALATGFSLLLGFIIFLGFSSYDESRVGAENEATLTLQQVSTAQLLPSDVSGELTGELVCYARTVVGPEAQAMSDGTLGDAINPWGVEMFKTISSVQPKTDTEQSAYDRWMDQTSQREQSRLARVHGAEGIVPAPLWFALFLLAGVITVYMLFFADPAEGAVTQGVLMGSVTLMMSVLILLLVFFNHPYGDGVGRLHPTAMERTLRLIEAEKSAVGLDIAPPCDDHGVN